jgi:ABC-type cobalamin/Fe3+-siderophores transport system ATPase subunit
MRIESISVRDHSPIRQFDVAQLQPIVIIAGANGSGKTRIKEALISTFRQPNSPLATIEIRSTRTEEISTWGSDRLTITPGTVNQALKQYMNTRVSGGMYVGTVIQVDSNRFVQPVNFRQLNLATPDPDDHDIPNSYYLGTFANRWQDLVNKIYEKAANRDNKIANHVKAHPDGTSAEALKVNPDPFVPYQDIFKKLLPGKALCGINPKSPTDFQYTIGQQGALPFGTLSSGEQEVVKITFDLMWKQIRHCVIVIDEPELHLHPTLAFRLIQTVRDLGEGTNQLVLFTHSADLISTYYSTGSVYFIDSSPSSDNQARQLSQLRVEHSSTARLASANLGLFAVGKKLVFVEGRDSSIDRLTYHKVAQKSFSDAYILPIGSVANIGALRSVVDELSNAVFGIDLFMVRDRDGLTPEQVAALHKNPRMRCLERRHVENYFFDEEVLSKVAHDFYLPEKLQNQRAISEALLDIAEKCLGAALVLSIKDYVDLNGALNGPSIKAPGSKGLDDIEAELCAQVEQESQKLASAFSASGLEQVIRRERAGLQASLRSGTWKRVFPGKMILSRFSGEFWGIELDRVRQAYLDVALNDKPAVLQDIVGMLEHFKSL